MFRLITLASVLIVVFVGEFVDLTSTLCYTYSFLKSPATKMQYFTLRSVCPYVHRIPIRMVFGTQPINRQSMQQASRKSQASKRQAKTSKMQDANDRR